MRAAVGLVWSVSALCMAAPAWAQTDPADDGPSVAEIIDASSPTEPTEPSEPAPTETLQPTPPPAPVAPPAEPAPKEPREIDIEREKETSSGKAVGTTLIILGGIGLAAGGAMMVIGSATKDDPERDPQTQQITALPENNTTLTYIGAGTFVAGAVVMALGGWIRWDWSDDEQTALSVEPWVSPTGAGLTGTF